MFNQILVVCTGNICRSPMAEGLLSNTLNNVNSLKKTVASAGIHAVVGYSADKFAQRVMQNHGFDISRHHARQLNIDLINWADLILVMEKEQKTTVELNYLCARGKIFCIGKWRDFDVPDPYCQPYNSFELAFDMIAKGVSDWASKFSEETKNEK